MVFEDKLEEARLQGARRRMQIVIILLASLFLVGLVFFVVSLFDFSGEKKLSTAGGENANFQQQIKEENRIKFIDELQIYENELEPRLKTSKAEIWKRDGLFEISEIKKETMAAFAGGEYDKALTSLTLLSEKTRVIVEEGEQIYAQSLENASALLQQDNHVEAQLHIDQALLIAPQSTEALALQEMAEKLQIILPLLEKAGVARSENDVRKEYEVLQEVADLDPERQGIAERMANLAAQLKEQGFEFHISSGFSAIQKGKLKKASYHLSEARKIAPERPELATLGAQIAEQRKVLRLQGFLKEAERAVRQDNWQQVQANYIKAAAEAPENKEVVLGLRRAEKIVGLQQMFSRIFANPYRLANTTGLNEAKNLLEQARDVMNYSFGLQQQSAQLQDLMVKLNRLIPVTIISDSKTYIQVRRVGKVGPVSEKTIQLKPGRYTFEGSRPGYKSKLKETLITYDLNSFTVTIICDEPI